MPEIEVNLATLQSGQGEIQQTFTRLQATLDTLDADLTPMTEIWTGAAQEAYLVCQRQWTEAAQSLAAVLNSVSRAVGAAHENYSATHQATIQVWA